MTHLIDILTTLVKRNSTLDKKGARHVQTERKKSNVSIARCKINFYSRTIERKKIIKRSAQDSTSSIIKDGVCSFGMCPGRRDNFCVCAPHNVTPANPRMHLFTVPFIHSIVKLVVKSTTRLFPFNSTIFTLRPK